MMQRSRYDWQTNDYFHFLIVEIIIHSYSFCLVIASVAASAIVPPSTLLPTTPAYYTNSYTTTIVYFSCHTNCNWWYDHPFHHHLQFYLKVYHHLCTGILIVIFLHHYLNQQSFLPSIPGPVQRPNSSFSPAPGTVNNTTSRCIQRPSPEPRSCSTNSAPFPLYSPMNYAVGSSTSGWNDTPITNTS